MTKATGEQELSIAFNGKESTSETMEDVVWIEFFEILGLFEENNGKD